MKIREKIIDRIKGVLILCVLMICADGAYLPATGELIRPIGSVDFVVWFLLRSLTAPVIGLFVFLAGYHIRTGDVIKRPKEYFKGQWKAVLLPFLLWTSIYTLAAFLSGEQKEPLDWLVSWLLGSNGVQLFYLLVFLQLALFTPFLCRSNGGKKSLFLIWSITFLSSFFHIWYWSKLQEPLPHGLLSFCGWIGIYSFGILISRFKKNATLPPEKQTLLFLVGTALFHLTESYYWMKTYGNPEIALSICGPTTVMYTLSAAMTLLILEQKLKNPPRKFDPFGVIGRHSRDIFFIFWLIEKPICSIPLFVEMRSRALLLTILCEVILTLAGCMLCIFVKERVLLAIKEAKRKKRALAYAQDEQAAPSAEAPSPKPPKKKKKKKNKKH